VRAQELLAGAIAVPVDEVAEAVRVIAERNKVVAEGAGACPVAAAMAGRAGKGKVVCVVSGGGIDTDRLVQILARCPRAASSGAPTSAECPRRRAAASWLLPLAIGAAVGACVAAAALRRRQ